MSFRFRSVFVLAFAVCLAWNCDGESGGYGMLVGPHATPEERREYVTQLRANPADFISQPVLPLSRAPCLANDRF